MLKLLQMKKLIEVKKLLKNELEIESWGRDGQAKVCASALSRYYQILILGFV